MTQLRKIEDIVGKVKWVPPKFCAVDETRQEVIVGAGFECVIAAPDVGRVLYILTMRDPRKFIDPLPEWMEAPGGSFYCRVAGEDSEAEFGELYMQGVERRREGVAAGVAGAQPSAPESAGWDDQQDIATQLYDDHVIGWE